VPEHCGVAVRPVGVDGADGEGSTTVTVIVLLNAKSAKWSRSPASNVTLLLPRLVDGLTAIVKVVLQLEPHEEIPLGLIFVTERPEGIGLRAPKCTAILLGVGLTVNDTFAEEPRSIVTLLADKFSRYAVNVAESQFPDPQEQTSKV
jgi:hypothetical protein